jgi:hypothetical protein
LAAVEFQTLMILDSEGSLGEYIEDGNRTGLRDAFTLLLPTGVCFNLTVYDDQMQQVNTDVISNGGFGSQKIAFVEYVRASQGATFRRYIIHLLLAVVT